MMSLVRYIVPSSIVVGLPVAYIGIPTVYVGSFPETNKAQTFLFGVFEHTGQQRRTVGVVQFS